MKLDLALGYDLAGRCGRSEGSKGQQMVGVPLTTRDHAGAAREEQGSKLGETAPELEADWQDFSLVIGRLYCVALE